MSEIKWVKVSTGIFDDEKIMYIEAMPNGNNIILIWFKLLCLAGKLNNGGVLKLNGNIPYTAKMLAAIFRTKEQLIVKALDVFNDFGMISRDDGTIVITNWAKHQNVEGMEKVREQNRDRQRNYRNKSNADVTLCNVTSNVTDNANSNAECNAQSNADVTLCNAHRIKNKELEEEYYSTFSNEKVCPTATVERIVNAWNELSVFGIPAVSSIRSGTKRHDMLRKRLADYGADEVVRAIENIKSSSFLKGGKGFTVTFDWFIKPNNFVKVLEGNYNDRKENDDDGATKQSAEQRYGVYC